MPINYEEQRQPSAPDMRRTRQPANDFGESSDRHARNQSHSERLPLLLEPAAEIVCGQSALVFAIEALVDRSGKPKMEAMAKYFAQ